ncbi:MAG: pyrroloquinoline quinone-dependent dehydrogenase [Acidobacteria bacterium]|nr:pyrroloquinoline quinone-dependent dehydrogenase [Acidobacteriota bacterium]MYA46255.1 pyrroloquinoline quinone-dependent dehydrogenase [Acidobacteriota bacterium]MYI39905.1 pyrroloquinoline quinone-dependent dehydrogenase [Acidobacteriota bacterium]
MRTARTGFAVALAALVLPLSGAYAQRADWETHGGDPGGMKYSWLDEINRDNVDRLEVAWSWETGEEPLSMASSPIRGEQVAPGKFQGTPVVLDGVMYVSTSYSRVAAIDAATGEELWAYDPRAYEWGNLPRGCRFCHRGVAVWTDGEERRVFINSRWMLVALDALTGEPIQSFGKDGVADLTENLMWETNRLLYTNTSPPVIYKDLVIVGSGVPDNRIFPRNPPGDVQAFNARTGEFVWSFHTIPQEGEYGNDTWEDGSASYTGSANVWAPFTVDAERGLVYLPISTPNNDYYGGHRKGDNLFAESIVCLDANTGRRVWHFQTVRHGIWDYDLPAPPNLITIEVDGETIDAVAVVGKTGFVYVFDRVTGEPVWPIEDRPVPASDVPGERAAATQPYPTKPPPFGRQGFTEDDLMDFTPELKARALEIVEDYRLGSLFDPPSLEGTVIMPGIWGAGNWGGAAFDPGTGMFYVKATNWPSVFRVSEPDSPLVEADYRGSGFGARLELVRGVPVHKPPYATLTAFDLNAGELLWQIPLGDSPQIRNHRLLRNLDLPQLGVGPPQHGQSAALVTEGGLLFISAASDHLYIFDKADGALLREIPLGGGGFGNPVTYLAGGRQLVSIATSQSDGSEAKILTFQLPR